MVKQLRHFVFKKIVATPRLVEKMAKKPRKMPYIAANKNGETPSQLNQHPKDADSTAQQLLLATVFGKMFASPIFSSLWSASAIVLKHLCMKIKPVSTGVTLHPQCSHGKRQSATRAFLKCMRVNFAITKFKISTVNSNVYQELGGERRGVL